MLHSCPVFLGILPHLFVLPLTPWWLVHRKGENEGSLWSWLATSHRSSFVLETFNLMALAMSIILKNKKKNMLLARIGRAWPCEGHHSHFSNTRNVMQQNNKPFCFGGRSQEAAECSDIFSASQLPQNTKATTARKIWMNAKGWGLAGKARILPHWLCLSLVNAIKPPCVILQLVGLTKKKKKNTTVHFLSGAWQKWACINPQCLWPVAWETLGLFPRCLAPDSSTMAGTLHG